MLNIVNHLSTSLKAFFRQAGFKKAVVGLSGGVDSALTLALAVRVLGTEAVTGLILPEAGASSPESAVLAEQVAVQFGVQAETVAIGGVLTEFRQALVWEGATEAHQNIAPRVRMAVLYHYALTHRALVLGTSNKSELLLGYGTKWGDFAADVEVLGSLWKTEVFALASELKIPAEIITREPTAELAPGQTDADELGADYATLDPILQQMEQNDFRLPAGADELTKRVWERHQANAHKTKLPLILGNSYTGHRK